MQFIVKASVYQDHFEQIIVNDLVFDSANSNFGHRDLMECSVSCLAKEDCVAFYRSSDGACYIIMKSDRIFPEKPYARKLQFWFRIYKFDKKCSSKKFPEHRGRSRYYLQLKLKNWNEAKEDCENKHSKLAELSTLAEQLFVARFSRKIAKPTDYPHVGLIQLPGSKTPKHGWVWYLSRERLAGLWDKQQPSGNIYENRGALSVATGYMHNILQNKDEKSVCECMLI